MSVNASPFVPVVSLNTRSQCPRFLLSARLVGLIKGRQKKKERREKREERREKREKKSGRRGRRCEHDHDHDDAFDDVEEEGGGARGRDMGSRVEPKEKRSGTRRE